MASDSTSFRLCSDYISKFGGCYSRSLAELELDLILRSPNLCVRFLERVGSFLPGSTVWTKWCLRGNYNNVHMCE